LAANLEINQFNWHYMQQRGKFHLVERVSIPKVDKLQSQPSGAEWWKLEQTISII
jgi:hypothetical protein